MLQDPAVQNFIARKSETSIALLQHFLAVFNEQGPVTVRATKTMLAVDHNGRTVAWITQLGKVFLHVVFPFKNAYPDQLCFIKITPLPGQKQYNHNFRMFYHDDVNDEIIYFMNKSFDKTT
ncbi:hypothetical protein LX64_01474 [Chitinophaga skermanii]|uniref:DUF5655 domain-containing protein n=1 Tax=Chitinophaga skermanii TaxID=331697 RepID=A0A327QWT9_9BACT|nr:hypothetical protein [Chitinophaga skermanii]RAJ08820.1 hypothetical protein LX64_01474 [Chitinophaga skermanii]